MEQLTKDNMEKNTKNSRKYEYEIPEGYEVRIEGNKVIIELKESEDERIRKEIIEFLTDGIWRANEISKVRETQKYAKWIAYLEKQKEQQSLPLELSIEDVETIKTALRESGLESPMNQEVYDKLEKIPASAYYLSTVERSKLYPDGRVERRRIGYIERQKDAIGAARQQGYEEGMEDGATMVESMQKEQKPSVCDGEIEDKKRDIVAAIRKYYPADYAEYLTSFLKGLSPEDNSEDEYGQEMLSIAYKLMYGHVPENLRTKEFWDSLKFMREYTGRVAIIHSYEKPAEWSKQSIIDALTKWLTEKIAPLHKKSLDGTITEKEEMFEAALLEMRSFVNSPDFQIVKDTSAEWSEEDKRKLNRIYDILGQAADTSKRIIADNEAIELQDFLKSLRPHWKPSKKQMNAIDAAQRELCSTEYNEGLCSLIDDLQKLL